MTMTSPSDPRRVGWRIVSQHQRTAADNAGNYVPGMTVTFQLSTGTTGNVFVPMATFTADNVQALISKQAQEMAKVNGLTG